MYGKGISYPDIDRIVTAWFLHLPNQLLLANGCVTTTELSLGEANERQKAKGKREYVRSLHTSRLWLTKVSCISENRLLDSNANCNSSSMSADIACCCSWTVSSAADSRSAASVRSWSIDYILWWIGCRRSDGGRNDVRVGSFCGRQR